MWDLIEREAIYLYYYLDIQVRQLFWFYVLGTLLGSAISVFGKDRLKRLLTAQVGVSMGFIGLILAACLGFASPICMHGTLPLVAALYHQGVRQDYLACFMVASVLLNPQLIAYSLALGPTVFTLRLVTCLIIALAAGLLIRHCFKDQPFFNFVNFGPGRNNDTHPNLAVRYLKNVGRNLTLLLCRYGALGPLLDSRTARCYRQRLRQGQSDERALCRDLRCSALFMWWRHHPDPHHVAGVGHVQGRSSGLYALGTCHQDQQLSRAQGGPGPQALLLLHRLCHHHRAHLGSCHPYPERYRRALAESLLRLEPSA